ncbi:MAG TPA: exodeoxyribonuclease VII large subunit [Ktedonobacterales bacterium]|nr:exodeoxyribonuclease VII large subunit [Ktedonobacterales bacterium]
MRIVAVSELTRYLKDLIAEDYFLQDVWVQGEISNYTQAASGHRYFSLKDGAATLRCALFAGYRTGQIRNGMAVFAHGRIGIWEQRGDLQFYVDDVRDAGIGELSLRFEALKARLEAEGLFAPERKRPLPDRVQVVGVVTSPQAAALRDILRTLRLRCPLVEVILAPTLVQGDGAAEQVAAAIDALNAHGRADVIVVARGGGSIEELWAFNEEVVARAIARSRIPVVTGVGHETDFTIADFVADLRASTPTAAAMAVTPDVTVWREAIGDFASRLDLAMAETLETQRDTLAHITRRLGRASPQRQIEDTRQRVDVVTQTLTMRLDHLLAMRREALRAHALRLHALSPLLTIARGYAIVRREPEGTIVSSVAQVSAGDGLSIMLEDGRIAAVAGPRLPDEPDMTSQTEQRADADTSVVAAHERGREGTQA